MDYDYSWNTGPLELGGAAELAHNDEKWAQEGKDWEVRRTIQSTAVRCPILEIAPVCCGGNYRQELCYIIISVT